MPVRVPGDGLSAPTRDGLIQPSLVTLVTGDRTTETYNEPEAAAGDHDNVSLDLEVERGRGPRRLRCEKKTVGKTAGNPLEYK